MNFREAFQQGKITADDVLDELKRLQILADRYEHLREYGDLGCTVKDGYGGQMLRVGEDLDAAVDKMKKQLQNKK